MTRNFREVERKEEDYSRSRIVAWKEVWEEYNPEKDKWFDKKRIVCHLFRNTSKNQPLNLGECNDGSPFTSVNQSVNQAKEIVNFLGD